MSQEEWPTVAVMGAGAVGSYFGGMLARSGAPVILIGRSAHVEAICRGGLVIERAGSLEQICLAASTEPDVARDAAIVLLSVKTPDTETAAKQLAPHLVGGAIVVSIQNGVDNVERIREASGIDAIPAVAYVAVEMTRPGSIRHTGRGDLVVGVPGSEPFDDPRRGRCHAISALFRRAGVPCDVSNDIEADLWAKLVMNCAYNAISALSRAHYGRLVRDTFARDLMRQVVVEIMDIARASGIGLPDEAGLVEEVWRLADGMPGAISSTAQDIVRGRRTEIDSLNGYIVRRGLELGIPTPVNRTLHSLVKLLENAPFE